MAVYEGHRADMHRFLVRMYEVSGGDRTKLLDMWEVGNGLGFSRDEINMIVQHLVVENLIDLRTHNGRVTITPHGILEVEEAKGDGQAQKSEQLFDAGDLEVLEEGSGIGDADNPTATADAVADARSTGKNTVVEPVPDPVPEAALDLSEQSSVKDLSGFVRNLRSRLPTLRLGTDDYGEMLADLGTIELQMASPRPKQKILLECVSTIGRILRESDSDTAEKLIDDLADLL